MSYRRRSLAAVVAILSCAFAVLGQSNDEHSQALESLKGLSNVVVNVQLGSTNAFPEDPTQNELQAHAETRLKEAGLIVSKRAGAAKDAYPTFVVSFGFGNIDIFYYEYEIRASLLQDVRLQRNPEVGVTAPTWVWTEGAMVGGSAKRNYFNQAIDQFICDVRKVNPDLKGPLPDCDRPSAPFSSGEEEPRKQPRVITELDEELIRAAGLNDLAEVKSLVTRGAEVNARDQADTTALTYAVRSGNRKVGDAEVVRFLLANGANPNANPSCRLTPLMYAVERGDLQSIQALLDHGADPNAATAEGYTALMAAAVLGNADAVSLLLKNRADAQAQTRQGQTAITLAQLNRNRIAAYDRSSPEVSYNSLPEPTLLKRAQAKHDLVIQLLQSAKPTRRN